MVYSQKQQTATTFAADTFRVNSLLQMFKEKFSEEPEKAIAYAVEARNLSDKIKYPKGSAAALKSIGISYYYSGKMVEALDYWERALRIFESMKDIIGVANILNNIGAVYFDQADDEKALEYYLKSLKLSEQTGDKLRITTALNNIGSLYFNKKVTHDKALHYYKLAMPLAEETGDIEAIRTTASNLGEAYDAKGQDSLALYYYKKSLKVAGDTESSPHTYNLVGKLFSEKGNYNAALSYHKKAYNIAKRFKGQLDIVQSLSSMGDAYEKKGNFELALAAYNEAEPIANEIKAYKELERIYKGAAASYAKLGKYAIAYDYKTSYASIKDSLYNQTTDKKLASMQFDFDLQKKQGEINLLTKDKSLRDLEIKRQKLAKRALIIGLVLLFLIAFIIYRDNRIKVRINKILDRQKVQIENLVLNILPSEVAKELQENGRATPRSYQQVSVLFSDFKGFSAIAEKMTPEELVTDLNECFIAFDAIIGKYGLEKIKTIGDSYMCAGGIPSPDINHPFTIVKAALEIQEFMKQFNKERKAQGVEPLEMRIGIHVGPVVAGVVGQKKYAYDIWGNTVNIASRMESNGAPGKVNISAATYELVKGKYICNHRGKIYAKNVGEIDMYFVERELDELVKTQVVKQMADSETVI
jgi:class 3 adenylate cyclase